MALSYLECRLEALRAAAKNRQGLIRGAWLQIMSKQELDQHVKFLSKTIDEIDYLERTLNAKPTP